MQPKSVFLKPGILPPIQFIDAVSKIIYAGLALQWRNYLTCRIASRSVRVRLLLTALFFRVYGLRRKERTERLPYSHPRRIRRGLQHLRQEDGKI